MKTTPGFQESRAQVASAVKFSFQHCKTGSKFTIIVTGLIWLEYHTSFCLAMGILWWCSSSCKFVILFVTWSIGCYCFRASGIVSVVFALFSQRVSGHSCDTLRELLHDPYFGWTAFSPKNEQWQDQTHMMSHLHLTKNVIE